MNEKLSWAGDIGIRGIVSNSDWNSFYIRPGVRYQFNHIIGIAGSVASFTTFNVGDYNTSELRFTSDANVKWPHTRYFSINYRLRFEKRFFFNQQSENSDNWRGRFLISVNSARIKAFHDIRRIYFKAQYETFQTFGEEYEYDTFIGQTRVHIIFGHYISKKFGYDIQYIWQKSRVTDQDDLKTTQNLVRIRFYHRIGMVK